MAYDRFGVTVGGVGLQAATKFSVNYPTQISSKRNLGANISEGDQFRFDGPSEVKLSIDFLLDTNSTYNNYDFLFDEDVFGNNSGQREFLVSVGAEYYQKCLIDDYSVSIQPFGPVKGTVNFTSYQPARGGGIAEFVVGDGTPDIIHGHNCSISGANEVVSANVVNNLSYRKTFGRTPVYGIGDTNASSFLIDSIEAEMTMSSTGLESLLAISGNEVVNDIVVEMENSLGVGIFENPFDTTDYFKLTIPSGSRVVAQDFGVQGGDSVATNVTIKNVIL